MWQAKNFESLTTYELYQIYFLRTKTFVVDQKRIYQEVDAHDLTAWHVFNITDQQVIAYARIFLEGDQLTFGRVVTDQKYRGQGLGRELMEQIFQTITAHFPSKPIAIEAQQQVEAFYQKFDFVSQGQPFIFESTPHIKMIHPALS